nr:hypothetical protein [Cytophagaceae bacterium]
PKATATIKLTPVHSYLQYKDRPNTFYKGDTIRYDIVVSSEKEISNFNVTVNGVSKISKTSFSSATGFTERLTYIIDAIPGSKIEIKATTKETTAIETSNSLSFTVSDLTEYKNLKIHNKESIDKADSINWYFKFAPKVYDYPYVSEEVVNYSISTDASVSFLRMFRQTSSSFSPSNTNKDFFKRIAFPYDLIGEKCRIIKSSEPYESFAYPNQIAKYFSKNENLLVGTTLPVSGIYIDPVSIGDVYIIEYVNTYYSTSPQTFFVLKITDIVDDGKTSSTGGNDNDYMQFDLKFFNMNRF